MRISTKTAIEVWLMAIFAVSGLCLPAAASDSRQPMIGDSAPAFALKSLDGKTVSLEQARGKFVVLHFAASW